MERNRSSRYRTQKSPDWRFLFVLRLLILIVFLGFAVILLFWDSLPFSENYMLSMPVNYRYAMGVVIIVYAIIRFVRLMPKKNEEE
ncbi:MAG: hypothetical protein V4581_08060 [Bacteroidota bacterium]